MVPSLPAFAPVPRHPPDDQGLRTVEALLREHVLSRQGDKIAGTDSLSRAGAPSERIDATLARAEPGSKLAVFLRGLRVLVAVEAIAPGVLAGRRSEAEGWISPLSLAVGKPGREACERLAPEFGADAATMRAALRFAEAVEVIARNCGGASFGQLLGPDRRLRVRVILSIARKGPERQSYAMAEAAQGRDPLARPAPGVWPMDTRDFEKVPGRLGRALGAVEGCIADLPVLLERQRPSGDEVAAMRRHLAGIVEHSGRLLRVLDRRGEGELPGREANGATRERPSESVVAEGPVRKGGPFARVRGRLDAAHYFVEKTARDVPRMPADLRPTPGRASQIRWQLLALIGRAGRLIEIIAAGSSRPGP